jgi:hypothetical protein
MAEADCCEISRRRLRYFEHSIFSPWNPSSAQPLSLGEGRSSAFNPASHGSASAAVTSGIMGYNVAVLIIGLPSGIMKRTAKRGNSKHIGLWRAIHSRYTL